MERVEDSLEDAGELVGVEGLGDGFDHANALHLELAFWFDAVDEEQAWQ